MAIAEGILAKVGESFLKDVYGTVKDKAIKKWQSFNWHTSQVWYYQKIERDYGTTRILGKPEPVKLEGIYTDVYLLDKPSAIKRFDILNLKNDPNKIKKNQKRLSGLELVKSEASRLFILGKPGAGKTTFLKYVVLKASKGEIPKIPIFVSLKEWADSGLGLMAFLAKQFDICHFPDSQPLIEYILEMGLAIVLFDGLDETQQEDGKREQIIAEIRDFSNKYTESQILITCRIAANDYTFEKFTYLELADFTSEQVENYVSKWFEKETEKLRQFREEFDRVENKGLREMASTPLLLSLLCLNFDDTGTFPQRRVEIYEEGINALLHKWDASRSIKRDDIYRGLSFGRKRQMFARIAAQTFDKNEYFLPKHKLAQMIVDYLGQLPNATEKEEIDGEAVLNSIEAQHSIFVERAKDIYSFSHLTFQEYFTAKYVVDNAVSGAIKQLLSCENIKANRWREVILNTASLVDNADSFIQIFHQSLNQIISGDEPLIQFLNRIEKKVSSIKTNMKPPSIKAFYIYLELTRSLIRSVDVDLPRAEALVVTINRIREIIQKVNTEIDYLQNLRIDLVKARTRNINFLPIISFSDNINLNHPDLILDFKLTFLYLMALSFKEKRILLENSKVIQSFIILCEEIQVLSNQTDNSNIAIAIQELFLPQKDLIKYDWKEISTELREIMILYRNIGNELHFSVEQYEKLTEYINVNNFLRECLKLVMISNRQEVENKLFVPV